MYTNSKRVFYSLLRTCNQDIPRLDLHSGATIALFASCVCYIYQNFECAYIPTSTCNKGYEKLGGPPLLFDPSYAPDDNSMYS